MRIALSKFFYLVIALVFSTAHSWALAPNPPEPPQGTVPPGLPIDTSISILIVAALVYAFYAIYKKTRIKT